MSAQSDQWPAIPLESWRDTLDTLHLYSQVPGKIRTKLAPPEPEFNHVTLYVAGRGLTTGPIPYGGRAFELAFDFVDHRFVIACSDGATSFIDLGQRSVASFYAAVMAGLRDCGVEVKISELPQEVPDPIPFSQDDKHASYDRAAVERFWRALVGIDTAFKAHRAPFRGRHSPVQLWWGSFDLGYERFSGRPAAPPPNANFIYRESMDAELINAGFWPGDARFPEPAFFAYAYPKPEGLESASIAPTAAFWSKELGEWALRYEDVRRSPSPHDMIMQFLSSTYDAAASRMRWDPELKGRS
ncbi:MAG TPA: DUF5996 family protein [Candidatus Eremiobacteraceae bacterium]|nr:DUF5996 family protein [Candidatus Eremiobacteraceae bacterium]